MVGEIGEAEKRGRTRQELSKIDAATAVLETKRKSEKAQADAELTNTQTKLDMNIELARIEARRNAESKDTELQRAVEVQRQVGNVHDTPSDVKLITILWRTQILERH